ncbi:Beta-hexosaminidase [Caprobacter fermentans]|uniref:Beta-hexosaminidase n=1 Tax=Caproicibacter fermentans TaxID=2576756 RepID=A0A6N8HYS7_9FIRM|nr:beta-N-acetylhexosaminidase [Caproicibacter fermentans]MVB10755.1 Beta-hexosaminidase [Caproicibacter fermentans]
MRKELTLRQKAGQRVMTGLAGTTPDPDFISMVREYQISNVILFRRNIENRSQLARLCGEIQDLILSETGSRALIAIDQEGGTVTRLPSDSVNIPGAMAIAATGDPLNAYKAGRITGRELKALGVNFNFAPVLDVNSNPENPLIGVRSYGDTPDPVSRFGIQMMRGLLEAGILCAAKHFPGHGDTDADSHLNLPCVGKSLPELLETELVPFRQAILHGLPAMMSTHILFPALEPEKIPATMSRRILTGLLKEKLGFGGLVITDCLEMKAIQDFYGTINGAVAAAGAGADMVLISHSNALASEAVLAIEDALRCGKLDLSESDASVEKILKLKEIYAQAPQGTLEAIRISDRETIREMTAKSVTPVGRPGQTLPPLGKNPCFVGSSIHQTTVVAETANGSLSFPSRMAERFGGHALVTPVDPVPADLEPVLANAGRFSCFVFGLNYGLKHPGQLKAANLLAETGVPTIAVSLREPYELKKLSADIYSLAAYEYSAAACDAVAKVLSGELSAAGRLPVTL